MISFLEDFGNEIEGALDICAPDAHLRMVLASRNVLMPMDAVMDIAQLDPADFHTAGWRGAHRDGRAHGIPAQTTPELLF